MKLAEVRDYLKHTIGNDKEWFGINKIDNTKDNAMCLYFRGKAGKNNIAIGGIEATGYIYEPLSLIIRCGKNSEKAEEKARMAYDAVRAKIFEINGYKCFLQAVFGMAICLGTDERGIFEYSIDIDFYYERGVI